MSAQIGQLLKTNNFGDSYDGTYAQVLFTLNNDKEIVVLSLDTEKKELESFIKARLNYKEVALGNLEAGKNYTVSVRIDV